MVSLSKVHSKSAINDARAASVNMNFEAVVIPVSDVERAKQFYTKPGWHLDADFGFDNGFRVVQFTPPGSGCSVQFGTKMTSAAPGSAQGMHLAVSDTLQKTAGWMLGRAKADLATALDKEVV